MASKSQVNMCEGPITRQLLTFAIPVLLTTICQALFNTADLIVVGKFSGNSNALAAVGATSSVTVLLTSLFNGLSLGAGICVSNYFGAKDKKSLENCAHTGIILSVIIGFTVMMLGFLLSKPLLLLLNTPTEIIDKSILYLKIYFISSFFGIIYNFCAALLRAVGDSKRCFYYIASSGVLNVLLNILFVTHFKLDVAGVAWATVISTACSAFLALSYIMRFDGWVKIIPSKLKLDLFQLKLITKIGVPIGLQSTCYSISSMLVQSAINTLGMDAVGGNTAATNIGNYVYFAMNCICSACSTFAAQNYGAKNFTRIKKSALISTSIVTATGVFLGVILNIFSNFFLGLYTNVPGEIELGKIRLLFFTLPYFLYGLIDLYGAFLKGMKRAFSVLIISLSGICAIRIIWILTVFEHFRTPQALYSSYTVSWIITLSVILAVFIYVFKKEAKRHPLDLQH